MTQLQEEGVTRDEELQRLDVLENEADQRFFNHSLLYVTYYEFHLRVFIVNV